MNQETSSKKRERKKERKEVEPSDRAKTIKETKNKGKIFTTPIFSPIQYPGEIDPPKLNPDYHFNIKPEKFLKFDRVLSVPITLSKIRMRKEIKIKLPLPRFLSTKSQLLSFPSIIFKRTLVIRLPMPTLSTVRHKKILEPNIHFRVGTISERRLLAIPPLSKVSSKGLRSIGEIQNTEKERLPSEFMELKPENMGPNPVFEQLPKEETAKESKEALSGVGALGDGGEGEGKEPEDIIDKLFTPLHGRGSFDWDINRPVCIILEGDKDEGRRIIEDIVSTRYTFQGVYKFSKSLPWGESGGERSELSDIKSKENSSIDKKIKEEDILIVSDKIDIEDKDKIVNSLREISHRGKKCVILYVKDNGKELKEEIKKITNVDVVAIKLPKYEFLDVVGKLVGVDPDISLTESTPDITIDSSWSKIVRLYEEKMEDLRCKLPYVAYYQERETETHYLMKRVVYNWLKNENPNKEIKVEEPIILDDQNKLKEIKPDVIMEDVSWEVETGYPSEEERELIRDSSDPFSRLTWKLGKYGETYKNVNVVFPSIYVHLFRKEIKEIKKYFNGKIKLKFYTINWSKASVVRYY